MLAARVVRTREEASAELTPAPLAVSVTQPIVDGTGILALFLLAVAGLMLTLVAVPVTIVRPRALVHLRHVHGSDIGVVGLALMLLAVLTLVLTQGGR